MIMDTERRFWERRQGGRLYSHVAPRMVRSSGPGHCSQVAGWRKCRPATPGLVEPQKLPVASRWCWSPPGGKRPFSATGGNAECSALAKGWRKRYRWFGSPVAYSKARTIAGIRSKQTEPGRQYRGLESHPARTVPRLSARKPAKSGIFSRECRFYLGGSGGHPRAPFPGKRWPPAAPRD